MKKSHKRITSLISSLIGLLVGFKLLEFLRSDRCLDLGGSITNWGACDFGDARAEVIPLKRMPSLALVITVSIVIYFVVNYFIKPVIGSI
ncbi:hypothetical protein [Pseudoalteromonas sp. GB43]